MMPLGMFSSRQFSGANLVTFAVYAALGGFFFLFVSFLQISMGYSPIAAGAASLPVTALMLVLSARSGALAQRIGARIPLTVGPLVIALGLLMLTRIEPGDAYLTGVLPGVIVFGLGLTLVVAPVTSTVLAAADTRHAGVASGINNAVSNGVDARGLAAISADSDSLSGGRRSYGRPADISKVQSQGRCRQDHDRWRPKLTPSGPRMCVIVVVWDSAAVPDRSRPSPRSRSRSASRSCSPQQPWPPCRRTATTARSSPPSAVPRCGWRE